MTNLSLCQSDSPHDGMSELFWQKNSLVTHIFFELCLLWYLAQGQIFGITLYIQNQKQSYWFIFWGFIFQNFMKKMSFLKKLFGYLPKFSALHPMTFSFISSIYWLFCDDGEQQPKVSHFPSERSRVGAAEVSESQGRQKVWKSGGGLGGQIVMWWA